MCDGGEVPGATRDDGSVGPTMPSFAAMRHDGREVSGIMKAEWLAAPPQGPGCYV